MGFSSHRLLPKITHVLFLLGFFLQASHSLLSESVAQVYQGCITRLSIHVDLFSLHALFPWYMSCDKKEIFLSKLVSCFRLIHMHA